MTINDFITLTKLLDATKVKLRMSEETYKFILRQADSGSSHDSAGRDLQMLQDLNGIPIVYEGQLFATVELSANDFPFSRIRVAFEAGS